MTDRPSDENLARLVGELVRALRDLEDELEGIDDRRRPPVPTPREFRRFASEVAIPGLILVLETNVRALRLLQRALELGDDAGRTGTRDELRDRASAAGETALDRLDDALAELGRAMEGRPGNEEAAELLEEARELRREVQSHLADRSGTTPEDAGDDRRTGADDGGDAVGIDVDAELESIRDELDDGPDGDGTDGGD